MLKRFIETLARHGWLRITLAVTLILIGTAPIGAPILSGSSWRPATAAPADFQGPAAATDVVYEYRWSVAGGLTSVERSDDGAKTWQTLASVPEPVVEFFATPGDESIVYARSKRALWISRDAGANWNEASGLPSRPLALAVTSKQSNALFVGTESVGLVVSRDQGMTWQVVNDPALSLGGAAPVAVTALAVNPEDESIVYASAGVWTGTSTTRLTTLGVFISVDGGRTWQIMEQSPLSFDQTTKLVPLPDRPLAVKAETAKGSGTVEMRYSDELAQQMQSIDPAVRASTAKILGLLEDPKAAPMLLPALEDDDLLAGDRAAEALGRINVPEAAPVLMASLSSPNEVIRARAALALGLMRDENAVGQLGEMLTTDSALPARRAAEALAEIGTPGALAALTAPLSDEELTPGRHAAVTGLERAGDRAVDPLIAALEASDAPTRSNAAEVLGFLRAEEAIPALAARLDDEDSQVRTQAAWALGEIGTLKAANALHSASARADEQTLAAIESAQMRAEAAQGEEVPSLGEVLLTRLAGVPLVRWTWFALMLFLAATLLLLVPRETARQRVRHRR
jgi:HEAT repeat protein